MSHKNLQAIGETMVTSFLSFASDATFVATAVGFSHREAQSGVMHGCAFQCAQQAGSLKIA